VSEPAFELAQVVFEGRESLAFAIEKPRDWQRLALPADETDLSTPTAFLPLAIFMAPYGAVVLTVAARPAYEDGAVSQWAEWLCEQNSLAIERRAVGRLSGAPALLAEATQPSEAGPMRVRLAFLEDGRRLVNLTCMAPEQIWESVEPIFARMLESFRLDRLHGPTAPLVPGDAAPVDATPAAGEASESAATASEGDASPPLEAGSAPPAPGAAAPPAATDEPTTPAAAALAEDAASLDPEHPVNARLRDGGAGLVPRVESVDTEARYAVLAAVAVDARFRVPLGWHVIDDTRRTLIFDAGGRMQINLDRRRREGRSDGEVLDGLLAEYRQGQPDIEFRRFDAGGFPCLALRNLRSGDEVLEQVFILKPSADATRALVARVTGSGDDIAFALGAAEVVLRSLEEISAREKWKRRRSPQQREAEWWTIAQHLERADKLEEAERLVLDSLDHLGVYSQLAHLYERRVSRLLAAGDTEGAMRAYERARHWLVLYAAGATSGGEGAALSQERDQRLAALRGALGLDA
jgi:hypothetical protein